MGLRTKQVPGDQGIDWGQTLLQSGAAEMPKPPSLRRQPPLQQQSEPLKCPRCGSTNTKFCYYNNYNRSQPRHFCKSCKRHWTKGGTLRNVPVGGGRKNKRPKISNAPPAAAAKIATTAALGQQDDGPNNFSLSADTTSVQRSMPDVLYQALIRSSPSLLHEAATDGIEIGFPGKPFVGSNGTNAMDPTEFQFSEGLSTIGANESLIPTSYQSINAYDHNYGGNLDPVVESTISSVHIDPSSSSEPWPRQDAGGGLDLPNYWNWSEIDALNPADLNLAWDDDVDDGAKIKL